MPPENNPLIVNPYIAGSPVKDATMFFGREDVYAWLRQHLHGAYQDNIIVLYGERRSGKTSILYQMKEGLGDDRDIPVLLDLQGMGLEGIDGFLHVDDLSYTEKVKNPEDKLKVDDEIELMAGLQYFYSPHLTLHAGFGPGFLSRRKRVALTGGFAGF